MQSVSIVLVGLGGYGGTYVNALLDAENQSRFRIVGVVDPKPEACERLKELQANGVPLFSSLEEFYQANRADLAVISTPIQFHASQICLAIGHGSHVLCEKPLCATAKDARRIVKASEETGRFVAVGYQWCFSDAILRLKKDILDGKYGKPLRMKTIVLWPRDTRYYQRSWAGRKYTNDGLCVFDSIANNACAHYLQNILFVLGDRVDRSAMPESVVAELYRANDIENFDTIALRMETKQCGEMLFLASHAVDVIRNPTFHYEFEKAEIIYSDSMTGENVVAVLRDGRRISYGNPGSETFTKLWQAIDAVRGGAELPCVAETALPHTLCIDAVQRSVTDIPYFPKDMIHMDSNDVVYAENLGILLEECYDKWGLPSECGAPWARLGNRIDLH